MSRARLVHDHLVNAPREAVAASTFRLLHQGQDMTPAEHLLASAAHLILLADHYKVPAQEVFTASKNLINHHNDRLGTDFEAIRMYLREENR